MRYKQRRRLYSQNFLANPKLIAKLIRNSSIGKSDTVLEIGAGRGIITQELVKIAGKVIAIEIDGKLYFHLKEKFKNAQRLELIHGDFLNFRLPPYPYKVFANIPLIITADVIRKLTSDENYQEGYLVVQKEAAKKFIGMPYDSRNQMISVLLKPWFEINIWWKFKREDFIPRPKVDTTMIRINRVKQPLIDKNQAGWYRDFIVYMYNRSKVARLDFKKLIELFNNYIARSSEREKRIISLEAERILAQQKNISKINRTRLDKNWRKFK